MKKLIVLPLLISNLAWAQFETGVSRMETAAKTSPFYVKANAVYFLLKGFSVAAGANLNENSSLELELQRYSVENRFWDDSKNQFTSVAVRGDIWFYRPIEERGFYLAGALNSVSLESEVTRWSGPGTVKHTDSKVGGQFVVGYQLDFLLNSDSYLRTKFGIGGGNGGAVRYSEEKATIESGGVLEASASYYF